MSSSSVYRTRLVTSPRRTRRLSNRACTSQPIHLNARKYLLKIAIGTRKRWEVRALANLSNALEERRMRTATLAMIVVAGSAIAFPATAQQQPAAPSEQSKEEMHRDVDKGSKTSEPNEQMQRDADKGIKTRQSGESGYVGMEEK